MGIVTQTIAAHPGTDADFGSQLQYSLTSVPDPLTVSPADSVETRNLIIVGSRISPKPIETNEISVYVPIGTEAWQLALDLTGLQPTTNLTKWDATVDPGGERILFKPNTGHATITEQGLTLQLNKLRINHQVGTAPINIELKWREPGTSNWETETQTLSIGKFPAGFYLRKLKPDSAYIENGDSVTLEWDASEGATYHLLYENIEIDVTDYSTFPVHDIRRNTMFYLRGRVQQGTATAERTINTYVTVNRPDLEIRNLAVHGELVMPRILRTASTDFGVADDHTPDLMLDGNLETYYLSAARPDNLKSVVFDLGAEQPIEEVDIYFGTPDGDHSTPGTTHLNSSLDGERWDSVTPFSHAGAEVHYTRHPTMPLRARYLQLRFYSVSLERVAIRSFEVRPKPEAMRITPASAVINVPLTTNGGVTASTVPWDQITGV
ncbi:discoidin domain-containing protein [Streptomyces sp. RLB3-17]|uniref:discoidin domain-containing protein n=1 Tax=Streptomyces sp. RLB3-17 TaxID=2594455 RepID=UPI0011652D84|nr:discoidin domain-containing protein [Streptomyces sp. RLB3-17]QDO45846.1 discoidin domain-containing protein [Streptomyces sp. RLB3-17]